MSIDKIKQGSEKIVLETDLPCLDLLAKGKVRDIYGLGEDLLFVATDRISAFDRILPNGIPGKGKVLTALSVYWFDWLSGIENIPQHHLLCSDFNQFPEECRPYRDQLEGRSTIVKQAQPLPVECIVRGYLAGSGWKDYQRNGAISGVDLPSGLLESDRLPQAIFTPSTKANDGQHDITMTFEEMQATIGSALSERIRTASLRIYDLASAKARACGIIIADTKMEFGIDRATGTLLLIDEVLTPDASRFWPASEYRPGQRQMSFDKQFVRDYLLSIQWKGDPPPPPLPEKIVQQTSARYLEALQRLTAPSS